MDIDRMMDDSPENSKEIPFMSLQQIALDSLHMAPAVSLQAQLQHQHPIQYPSNDHNSAEITNQGAYAINPFSSMMPINSRTSASNDLPSTANNVPPTSGVGISNSRERLAPSNDSMNAYPYMNVGNGDESNGMLPIMASIPIFTQSTVVNLDHIVPMFNNLEPIKLTHAVLTPPLPSQRRRLPKKPPGCRTVFVDNLPEKITEEIIKEAFAVCGPISSVRMAKKFCHIRFVNKDSVDQALLLSDFRIRIDDSEDPTYNGKLFVDYTLSRDDQRDYECEQARLLEDHPKGAFRPPLPPPVPQFSEHEAQAVAERLHKDETSNKVESIIPMFNNVAPIKTTRAVLNPPLPGERRTRRKKPPGCRTVFVGKLPEKITEEIIKEAFKICGQISVVRMSKKNFCHIRFENKESVEQALLLSGFRIRIDDSEDPAFNSRLHVDYAIARDDQHDYECLERARLQEEGQHPKEASRPSSPLPVSHFSEHEAQAFAKRLHNDETWNNVESVCPRYNTVAAIETTRAVLSPPLPGERRALRPKPPGCKTVFVGNLPEKINEEIIKEAFEICGPISVVHMSRKNFCHIRFADKDSVEMAILLSGYRIRIDGSEDPAYNGRLHIDYAVTREDCHDYDCLVQARERVERYCQKEAFDPPSPPPVLHFSEHEAQALTERLHNDESFQECMQLLVTWLESIECNIINAGIFYALIECAHCHLIRLRNNKSSIAQNINEIQKVFVAAKTSRVWDHFAQGQRESIEDMEDDTCDLKQAIFEDLLGQEEESELSDSEESEGDQLQLVPADELSALREKVNRLTEELEIAHQTIKEFEAHRDKQLDEIAKLRLELKESKILGESGSYLPVDFNNQYSLKDGAGQYRWSRMITIENVFQLGFLIFLFFCMFTLWYGH